MVLVLLGGHFFFRGALVALSNWHVFCSKGNDTQFGHRIKLKNRNIASLYGYYDIYPNRSNLWDLALAHYDTHGDAISEVRLCEDGHQYKYPMKLGEHVRLGRDKTFWKAGARTPICRKGHLIAVGSRVVKYPNCGWKVLFEDQLVFSKMTDPGDSGSIIVGLDDNLIYGLNFAGNEFETIANPLFKIGWKYDGIRALDNGINIPMYSGGEGIFCENDTPIRKDFPSYTDFFPQGIANANGFLCTQIEPNQYYLIKEKHGVWLKLIKPTDEKTRFWYNTNNGITLLTFT